MNSNRRFQMLDLKSKKIRQCFIQWTLLAIFSCMNLAAIAKEAESSVYSMRAYMMFKTTFNQTQEKHYKNNSPPMTNQEMLNKNSTNSTLNSPSSKDGFDILSSKNPADTAVDLISNDHQLKLNWLELDLLPNSTGVAGGFVGVAGGALVLAGGANFPDGGAPWMGSKKAWYDTIYVLDDLEGQWHIAGHLPRPLGYGVSINWKQQMILLGGSNEQGHFAEVWRLSYEQGKLRMDSLPKLPGRMANTSGALVGDYIYVAGGQVAPEDKSASTVCWRIDLTASDPAWEPLPSWPGEGRMLSVAGSLGGKFYLFSGTALKDGKRAYLKDAYCYDPHKHNGKEIGWYPVAELPNPVVAAPGPAFVWQNKLYIFGGDDGSLANQAADLKDAHPGFSNEILCYDPKADKWTDAGKCWTDKKADAITNPNGSIWAPVTTSLTCWKDAVILAGGEVRPSTRTPRVLMGSFK